MSSLTKSTAHRVLRPRSCASPHVGCPAPSFQHVMRYILRKTFMLLHECLNACKSERSAAGSGSIAKPFGGVQVHTKKKPSDVVVQSRVPRPPGTGRESSVAFWCHRPYPPSHLLPPVSVDSVHQRTPSAFGKPRNKETQCNKIDPSSTVVNMHATIQQHGQLSHPTSVARSATEAITHVRQIESTIAFHCVCNARATRAQMSQPTKHKYIDKCAL